ncbi:hypothetical protein A9Q84_19360 [Halobacteriovorax marinus]|uniref:Glycosyl transferase family 1 domain-containing protein n=1 Tax=Halobacteriovorax marinus TaxID=97084 RepID=A0A1Y5F6E8_9BACT|nr:hypothetical protein A9Q84_19360 [Halobacteriovorax marinus]
MKVLILTTEENFKWTSMQEIIPSIENLWLSMSSDEITVEKVCVDELNLKEHMPKFLAADKFVVTAFNLKIVKAFEIIKKVLNHEGQTFFYVHNMATIGCWPLNYWKFSDLLTTNDVFVVSCERDIDSLRINYDNCRTVLTPFTYTDHVVNSKKVKVEKSSDADFVFVGRVSAQKNLHSLIWGFSNFIKKNLSSARLVIYGKEDHLGSPNMGMSCDSYMDHLKSLTKTLRLEDKVIFKGFVDRDEISRDLESRDHVMVSPSLHSDENFGMAAFKYLISGKRCILSDWGGHSDYIHSFTDQLELISVRNSTLGPVLSATDIEEAMKNVSNKDNFEPHFPAQYSLDSIQETLKEALKDQREQEGLSIHSHSSGLLENQEAHGKIIDNKFSEKIFKDYRDLLSKEFFSHYGMIESLEHQVFDRNLYQLAPWLEIQENTIVGKDFHKGEIEIALDKGTYPIVDISRNKRSVSKNLIQKLLTLGYLHLSNLDLDVERFKEDRCNTSIDILKERVSSYLKTIGVDNLYFPDADDNFPTSTEATNVVLFGGYLKRFLESGCWCFDKMHFWVLSSSVKEVLISLCNLPENTISVIEREKIFDVKPTAEVDLTGEVDLVYAGRLSRVKNIELLVQTVFYLQSIHNCQVRLNIIGSFEDESHDYWGYFTETSYENEIVKLINELDWKYAKPIVHTHVNWEEWPKKEFNKPHYISLSSFLSEDFAVSVAQAEEAQWPCILSNWGAHRDVSGALLLPMNFIVPFLKKNVLSDIYAKRLAHFIFKNQTNQNKPLILKKNDQVEYLKIEDLDRLRRNFVKTWGSEILSLSSNEGWKFAASEKGQIFYRTLVSNLGHFIERANIVLIQEGLNEITSISKELSTLFHNIDELEGFDVLSATEVLQKQYMKKLMTSENIFLTFDSGGCETLISTIESIVGEDKIVHLRGGSR